MKKLGILVFCVMIGLGVLATSIPQPAFAEEAAAVEFVVPESGTPEEYLAFVEKVLNSPQPDAKTEEEFAKAMAQRLAICAAAAEKIMAHKDATDEQYQNAVSIRIGAARVKSRISDDPEILLAEIQKIQQEAEKAGRAEIAQELAKAMLVSELGLAVQKGKDEFLVALKKIIAYFESKGKALGVEDFGLARQTVMMTEYVAGAPAAAKVCKKYIDLFGASEDVNAPRMVEYFQTPLKRFSLPGKELSFTAELLDGTALDMDAKVGKVVLVDFWATWCGPCVAEIPNMKKMYEAYHAKGFEIVGISLDDDVDELKEFLKENEIPWSVVLNTATKIEGAEMADFCGVEGIPCMILLGKDGKVISTNARGEELEKLLGELLGAVKN